MIRCSWVVVRCSSFVVRCSLFVVRSSWFVVRRSLFVVIEITAVAEARTRVRALLSAGSQHQKAARSKGTPVRTACVSGRSVRSSTIEATEITEVAASPHASKGTLVRTACVSGRSVLSEPGATATGLFGSQFRNK